MLLLKKVSKYEYELIKCKHKSLIDAEMITFNAMSYKAAKHYAYKFSNHNKIIRQPTLNYERDLVPSDPYEFNYNYKTY